MAHFIFRASCLFAVLIGISAKPEVRFYDDATIDSSTFSFHSSVDRPNLEATWKYLPYNGRLICYTGIWVFHWGSENYGPSTVFTNEIWVDQCNIHRPEAYAGSIRFVGEIGGGRRLNLYSGTEYTHNATTITENQNVVSTHFTSFILAGNESVQLFRQPNYQGTPICVRATQISYAAVQDIASLNLRPGDVQSILFGGCSLAAVPINAPSRVKATSLIDTHFN